MGLPMKKEHKKPPAWINKILERHCDDYLWEGISGDLLEDFRMHVETKGYRRAKWIYFFQSLGFLRLIFRKKDKKRVIMKAIWLNYFLTTLRSIKKHKAYFAINLIGLVLAITCGWFALVYIQDELKFDQAHTDKDHIYRLYKRNFNPNENIDHFTYETSGMMAPTMKDEFPEVKDFTRFSPWFDAATLSYEEINVATEKFYFADANFFTFFDFPIIAGNSETFLDAPLTMVLSESMAVSLFGNEDPIGKSVVGLHDLNYTITGVFKEVDRHSSMDFDVVVSWSTTVPNVGPLSYTWMNNWLAQSIFSFVKLEVNADPDPLVKKLPEMLGRHFEEKADQYTLQLVSLNEMYLSGDRIKYSRGTKNGSKTFLIVLGFSALLILIIASFNYVNITLSRATHTLQEVGIRKLLGSTKRHLMGRFMIETFLSTMIAAIISIVIILLNLPKINTLISKELPLIVFFEPLSIGGIILFVLAISMIVGAYPAWILSTPQVSTILKKSVTNRRQGTLKKVLLTIQYAISVLLIICTIFITRQTSYLENKPLGFEKENVIVIDTNNEVGQNAAVFEQELLKHPNILDASTSRSAIGAGSYTTTILPEGRTEEMSVRIFGVDPGFFDVYGMDTHLGRMFLRGSIADSSNMIVNQAFIDHLGWKDPLGKKIRFRPEGDQYPIIGVVKDFHYNSLSTSQIEPMVLYLNPVTKWNTSIRVGNEDLKSTIEHIEKSWNRLATRTPLSFFFVDDWFNGQYLKEQQLFKIATLYAFISLLLCGLGLYGLTSLQLQQRMKEISIRKILGASVRSIVNMINRQFVIIILISFITMVPIAYYIVSNWLDQFAYRIDMDIIPFFLAGMITLVTSLTIIGILSTLSANTNPANNLRSE